MHTSLLEGQCDFQTVCFTRANHADESVWTALMLPLFVALGVKIILGPQLAHPASFFWVPGREAQSQFLEHRIEPEECAEAGPPPFPKSLALANQCTRHRNITAHGILGIAAQMPPRANFLFSAQSRQGGSSART